MCFSGLQDVLPEFLRGRFVEAALSYVACNSEGELLCRNNDCWCRCSARFPECNCPFADIKVMEENLEKSKEAWSSFNQEFMESGKACEGSYASNLYKLQTAQGEFVLNELFSWIGMTNQIMAVCVGNKDTILLYHLQL